MFVQPYKLGDSVLVVLFSDEKCAVVLTDKLRLRCDQSCEIARDDNLKLSFGFKTQCHRLFDGTVLTSPPGPWNQPFKLFIRGVNVSATQEADADVAEEERGKQVQDAGDAPSRPPPRMYHAAALETINMKAPTRARAALRMFIFGGASEGSSIYPQFAW